MYVLRVHASACREAAQHYQARTDELFSALTQAAAAATQLSNDEHGCRSHLELMGINPDSAAEHMAQYRTVLEHIKQVPEFPRESIKERDRMIGKRARKARKVSRWSSEHVRS